MKIWHSKAVGDGVEAFEPTQRLFDAFNLLEIAVKQEPGLGVFSRYDHHANIVTWYFSPEAIDLAKSFGATPCEKPAPSEGFGLLVGYMQSWETHFSGYIGAGGA
jgi:hypothetical protein